MLTIVYEMSMFVDRPNLVASFVLRRDAERFVEMMDSKGMMIIEVKNRTNWEAIRESLELKLAASA